MSIWMNIWTCQHQASHFTSTWICSQNTSTPPKENSSSNSTISRSKYWRMIFISLSAFSVSLRSLHLEFRLRDAPMSAGSPSQLRPKERFHAIAKLFQHISSPAIETQTDTCEVDWNPRQSIPTKKTCNHRHIFSIPPCSKSVDPKLKKMPPQPLKPPKMKNTNSKVPSSLKVSTTRPVMAFSWALHVWGFHPFLRKATKMVCKNYMLRQVSFRRRVMANFPLASLEVSQNHTSFFTDPRSTGVHKVALIPRPTSEEHHWLANKEPLHILDTTYTCSTLHI